MDPSPARSHGEVRDTAPGGSPSYGTCACRHAAMTRIVSDTMTRIVSDTMIRLSCDPRALLLGLVFALGACTPPRPDPAAIAAQLAYERAWLEANEQSMVRITAQDLQLRQFADPEVRANPWPCARAVVAAQQRGDIYPACYADAIRREWATTVPVVPLLLRAPRGR